jgi:hypothetical protein
VRARRAQERLDLGEVSEDELALNRRPTERSLLNYGVAVIPDCEGHRERMLAQPSLLGCMNRLFREPAKTARAVCT